MAAWFWILEDLLGQPDVSIDAIKELLRYVVGNGGDIHPSLKKRLVVRHLEEFLGSDEPFEPGMTARLVDDLDLPNEDRDRIVAWMTDADPKARMNLVQYIQREKASLDVPVLREIARDVATGTYPVPLRTDYTLGCQASGDRPEQAEHETNLPGDKSEGFANVNTVRHHRSVGSEDTTVIIDGNGAGTKHDHNAAAEDQEEKSASPDSAAARGKALSENVETGNEEAKLSAEDVEEDNEKQQHGGLEIAPDKNLDDCFKCNSNKRDRLICCAGCPMAMHPVCAGLKEIPEGDWNCPLCVIRIANETVAKAQRQAFLAKVQYDKLYAKRKKSADEEYVLSPKRRKDQNTDHSSPDHARGESGRVSMPGSRRQKLPWSPMEEEALKECMSKVRNDGRIRWMSILEMGHAKFDSTRTAMDLKDKWRNILKQNT